MKSFDIMVFSVAFPFALCMYILIENVNGSGAIVSKIFSCFVSTIVDINIVF